MFAHFLFVFLMLSIVFFCLVLVDTYAISYGYFLVLLGIFAHFCIFCGSQQNATNTFTRVFVCVQNSQDLPMSDINCVI